jgi:2-hydroxyglutaryl-CoA dehydratase D-component
VSALAELRAAYADRNAAAAAWRAGGGTVVGYVGLDVPRELIEAAGCFALRLAPVEGVDPAEADRVLGRGVDEAHRRVLAGLLAGAYPIDRLVVCHDSDHSVRLYTTARALELPGIELWFLDLLHEARATTDAYDRARLVELADWLGARDLPAAIAVANRARALGDRLAGLRRAGRVSGADALALLGAGTALPGERYAALLEQALEELPGPEIAATSVLLLGSGHERADVYAAIDVLGGCVVGETHAWGETLLAGRVDETGDPLDALVRHYRPRPRALPPAADVQLAWLRRGDETWAWALPGERRRLGRPIVTLRDRPYDLDGASRSDLEELLA